MAQLPPKPKKPPGRPTTLLSRFLNPPTKYQKDMDAYINQLTNYIQPMGPMAPPTVSWPGGQGNIYPGSMGGGTAPTYGSGGPWNVPAVGSPQGVAGAMQNAVGGLNQAVTVPGLDPVDLYKASRPQAGTRWPSPNQVRQIVGGNLAQTGQNVGMDLLNQMVAYFTSPPNFAPSQPSPGAVPVGGPVPIPAGYNPNAPIGPGNVSPGAPGTGYNYPSGPQAPSVNPGIPMFPPAYDPSIPAPPGPDPAIGPAWNPAIGAAPPSFPDPTTWGRRY